MSINHGTTSAYNHHGCRCDECRAAITAYGRQRYAANREQVLERQRLYYDANAEKERERQRILRESRRAECLALLGGVCVRCGAEDRKLPNGRWLLEFDHIQKATKSFNITPKLSGSWDVLLPELRKCALRCTPCHKAKTAEDYKPGLYAREEVPNGAT